MMGVRELVQAFNAVAAPRYTCQKALSWYEPTEGPQVQRLEFSGRGADGNGFVVKSEQFNPNIDPTQVARATAQALLDKQEQLT